MRFGLIGEKLGHSFSKEIHEAIGSCPYELKELPPEAVPGFITAAEFDGINVTIPYKQTVIPYLDSIDEAARLIGAVNTIVKRGGKLCGYNTDFSGMRALFDHVGLDPKGKKVLILGTGGTSKTALALMRYLGADSVTRVSRTAREDAITYEEALSKHTDAEIIINSTPCGMYPHGEGCPIDISLFPKLEGVIDAIYNPLRTNLVEDARERGLKAEGGLYMLVAQAVLAAELFLDTKLESGTLDRVYEKILSEKENIVLVGMPASGKSTVGRLLAEKTGLPFYDADDEIVREAGMPITEIFKQYGEPYFRDLEAKVTASLSTHGGQIISTGGGTLLRHDNLRALRSNGRLYMIDRPLEGLIPTDSRPLSSSVEQMRALYEYRHPILTAGADVIIPVTGDAASVADAILAEAFQKR